MGLSDYFGRFWFAAEPIFGIVMTLCFLGILRNQALYNYPLLVDRVTAMLLEAAIACCIAWGIVDGVFYAWENHSIATRKNLIAKYTKNEAVKGESLKMVAEDLEDSYVDILDDADKEAIYDKVLSKMATSGFKEKVPVKSDVITIFLDFCLNLGACLIIILPFLLLQGFFDVRTLLSISVIIAIVLMFIIGVWTQTQKDLRLKIRKGVLYASLGVIITVLTFLLGG